MSAGPLQLPQDVKTGYANDSAISYDTSIQGRYKIHRFHPDLSILVDEMIYVFFCGDWCSLRPATT